MAKIRNTAAMLHTGRIGNTTYYVSKGEQIARVSRNSSNYGADASRTTAQQSNRVKWANLVNFYRASASWMKKAFENKTKRQSDYNKFMSVNLPAARVYLPKNLAAMGACVVDAYRVSEGSLPSIAVNAEGPGWMTSIELGTLAITDATTVAEFTLAVLANNKTITEGMQISFVSYQQDIDGAGVPRPICTAYEVTLSRTNTATLRSYLPGFCTAVVKGCLGTSSNISVGGFAYVLSDSTTGTTRVSSQTLINNNQELLDTYTSASAKEDAIVSYGVDADVFLMSGSEPSTPAGQPQYISGIAVNNIVIVNGGRTIGVYDPEDFSTMSISLALPFTTISKVVVRAASGTPSVVTMPGSAWDKIGNLVTSNADAYTELIKLTKPIKEVEVTADGVVYTASFVTELDPLG